MKLHESVLPEEAMVISELMEAIKDWNKAEGRYHAAMRECWRMDIDLKIDRTIENPTVSKENRLELMRATRKTIIVQSEDDDVDA